MSKNQIFLNWLDVISDSRICSKCNVLSEQVPRTLTLNTVDSIEKKLSVIKSMEGLVVMTRASGGQGYISLFHHKCGTSGI
eukprot:2371592-Ditylum_brightwellii.AAC.1